MSALEAERDLMLAKLMRQQAEIDRLKAEVDNARASEATYRKYAESYAQAATDIRETLRKAATASLKPDAPVRIEAY